VFRGNGNAHATKFAAGLHGLGRVGEALDEGTQLAGTSFVLFETEERHALVKVRGGHLVAVGVLLEDGVEGFDCCLVVAVAVVNLCLVIEGVS